MEANLQNLQKLVDEYRKNTYKIRPRILETLQSNRDAVTTAFAAYKNAVNELDKGRSRFKRATQLPEFEEYVDLQTIASETAARLDRLDLYCKALDEVASECARRIIEYRGADFVEKWAGTPTHYKNFIKAFTKPLEGLEGARFVVIASEAYGRFDYWSDKRDAYNYGEKHVYMRSFGWTGVHSYEFQALDGLENLPELPDLKQIKAAAKRAAKTRAKLCKLIETTADKAAELTHTELLDLVCLRDYARKGAPVHRLNW